MRITILLLLIVFLLAAVGSLFAQDGSEYYIMMANSLLLRIRCSASGYSAQERANAIQNRVNDLIIPGGIDLDTVQVRTTGNTTAIYADGRLLVTVCECDARINHTTVEKLANQWAARFKSIYPKIIPPPQNQNPLSL